ncbi:MAG: metallopeptidase family protein [Deltaproteobacteria bacterium]|nr:metallopeptidase family protein [Deltaproteobacteria bacterium]MBI3295499.1 metallopeptidase family protein [Deltaproteobacteria bacterium]
MELQARLPFSAQCGHGSEGATFSELGNADILATEHTWIETATAACAHTDLTARAPITLSYVTCRDTAAVRKDIWKVLIHESVHHLGVDDESFADAVAEEVVKAKGEESPVGCVASVAVAGSTPVTKEFEVPYRLEKGITIQGANFGVSHYPDYNLEIRLAGAIARSGGQDGLQSADNVMAVTADRTASLECYFSRGR